jgi:hypothetical protein
MIKSIRMRWTGHVARIGEKRNAYRILIVKPERKGSLGIPTRKWEDNIKMNLREIRWGDMDRIYLDQNRNQWKVLVDTVMNRQVP